ncbi:hypothetical protein B4123_1138 [Bacillus paralicheniformis]|nr:hypothetical protein B4123_1138 [Bacillus paralicheniformis]TWJ45673.1 hypothetical protein CHCC5027_2414 [Bacillus paralicheniformis]TWK48384.1 hypothetical protein CHCC20347_0834 [Bacillus paralicheniformis]TWL44912.1 hypothetical protein CHCC15337_2778 [Bacillus paralicheniformis]TWM49492.1 hypothetical protein CHCC14817_3368 [Bacillus paralicheniformis]
MFYILHFFSSFLARIFVVFYVPLMPRVLDGCHGLPVF